MVPLNVEGVAEVVPLVSVKVVVDPIYQTPPLGQDMTIGQFFKRSLTGLNSEFSFS